MKGIGMNWMRGLGRRIEEWLGAVRVDRGKGKRIYS
jgi:hypothetical protein